VAERYPFLSEEWMAEANRIREEFRGQVQAGGHVIRMNQVITDVPFGDGTVMAHVDSSSGELEMGTGHLDTPDVTITLDYDTARSIFVDGNPQAGMQAFMAGRIKVQGDMTELLLLAQQVNPGPAANEVQQRIKDLTE
jgi:putative sterol carrier protein